MRHAEFYGQTGKNQTELVLAMRLGGYGDLSMGEAWFKNISMQKLDELPDNALSLEPIAYGGGQENSGAPGWGGIMVGTLLSGLLLALVYRRVVIRRRPDGVKIARSQFILVLLFANLLRMALSITFVGHSTDIACFTAWADAMAEYGPAGFYYSDMFADYPPGYMYVLWLLGCVRRLLSLPYNGAAFVFLVKLPSIAADMVSAYLIYRMAKKLGAREDKAFALFGVVALFPAFAFISGGWGQIDSLLTLCLMGVMLLLTDKKLILAGALYGLAILIKPQALMAGPILAVAYFAPVAGEAYRKRLMKTALAVLAALAVIVGLSLPFMPPGDIAGTPRWLMEKYFSTATSYPYASVEAFNFFALLGGNWQSIDASPFLFDYNTWGVIFIAASVIAAAALYVFTYKKNAKGALLISAAFLLVSLFIMGPYMHERYIFPAILMLLAAGLYYNDKRLFGISFYFSVTLLFNALCAMYIVDHQEQRGEFYDLLVFIGSLASVAGFGYFIYLCVDILRGGKKETALFAAGEEPARAHPPARDADMPEEPLMQTGLYEKRLLFTGRDTLYCVVLTVVYACFALFNLGSLSAPETNYVSDTPGETVRVALPESTQLSELWVFGNIAEGSALITAGGGEELVFEQKYDDMFRWKRVPFDGVTVPCDSVSFMTYAGGLNINEVAFFDDGGKYVTAVAEDAAAVPLCDEQAAVPDTPSYYNGMYFDELYHARTAYEHLHGLPPYENSHPPLGKVFIMLGVAVFGMNPFGWRVVGALFGVGMVPLVYCFGKRLFKKPAYALLTAALFAFDFMHFTQTRIATIDVFGVFFIIMMFYYMHRYYCMSFYADGLKATLRPLGLAGFFFGLGAASKWICVYAGIGLAALLLLSLFKRYKEYKAATASNDEAAKAAVKNFRRLTVKTLAWCCVFYIAVPAVIYILSYTPYYFSQMRYELADVWNFQIYMWNYHSGLTATHPFQSAWWQWPFTLRPMWYYMGDSEPAGMISTLTASGNPAVWWVCTIAALALAVRAITKKIKRAPGMTMAFAGVLANYLPWVLVGRCTFIYHFFATVPFIIFCAVYALRHYEERDEKLRCVKWVWLGVCVLLFLLLYPGISGFTIPIGYAKILKFLPGGGLMYGA
ncbi:MAG: glycosyltransferase family 39 protein [Clostridiales bacterium]|jgi:Gpi18-like mannosyltransferase/predicted membrane-bound dolichyl-phosphate-mannose-protein mannosyltransferase|nr:glycosyltransferase family 39 protein [Clostridiales bacterium]